MTSPTGIIPEELMFPGKKREVMDFIKRAPCEAKFKRGLLLDWARVVGVRLQRREFRAVEATGIDRPQSGA